MHTQPTFEGSVGGLVCIRWLTSDQFALKKHEMSTANAIIAMSKEEIHDATTDLLERVDFAHWNMIYNRINALRIAWEEVMQQKVAFDADPNSIGEDLAATLMISQILPLRLPFYEWDAKIPADLLPTKTKEEAKSVSAPTENGQAKRKRFFDEGSDDDSDEGPAAKRVREDGQAKRKRFFDDGSDDDPDEGPAAKRVKETNQAKRQRAFDDDSESDDGSDYDDSDDDSDEGPASKRAKENKQAKRKHSFDDGSDDESPAAKKLWYE